MALTPPAPPTYVPTPIGPPPGPPSPTGAPVGTPSAGTPPPTSPTPVATTVSTLQFRLDAVRLSRVGNPGNLAGLAAARPGSKVWLMMYYRVSMLPRSMERTTVYTITYKSRTIYRVSYRSVMRPSEQGRSSRYTVYTIPRTLPYGAYLFRATLLIGRDAQSKSWKFALAKQNREIRAGSK
jgi:hypothetical protein